MRDPGSASASANQARPQAGQGLELVVHEPLEGAVDGVRPHQRRVADVALQPEVVSRPGGDRDPHPGAVHLGDRGDGRSGGHQVGRLDLAIGGGERDLLRALRLRPDQTDVPGTRPGRVRQLARPRIGHVADRHAEPVGDRARHVGRHALRVAGGAAAGHEQEVAQIDARAQHAGGRQLGEDVLRHSPASVASWLGGAARGWAPVGEAAAAGWHRAPPPRNASSGQRAASSFPPTPPAALAGALRKGIGSHRGRGGKPRHTAPCRPDGGGRPQLDDIASPRTIRWGRSIVAATSKVAGPGCRRDHPDRVVGPGRGVKLDEASGRGGPASRRRPARQWTEADRFLGRQFATRACHGRAHSVALWSPSP
jgi:hypothetical protein